MTILQFLLIYLATTTIASAIALGVFLLIKGDAAVAKALGETK